ncbi:MAG: hypothetical protein ACKVHP_06135, partial [Verrucomicrobiales bacterium]
SALPDTAERETFLRALEDLLKLYRNNTELADQLCEGVSLSEKHSTSELAAWTMLVSSIYNLDITKTRQ